MSTENNHETHNQSKQTDTLTDLPVAGEQAEETKGGPFNSASINVLLGDGSAR
jgi:hypothetical protein